MLHVAPSVWPSFCVGNQEAMLRLVVGVLVIPPFAGHDVGVEVTPWLWLAEHNVVELHFRIMRDGDIRAPIVAVNTWAQRAS